MYLECSRFHPNRFTFGGVIAERVNTTKSRPKVSPIFGRSYSFQPNKYTPLSIKRVTLFFAITPVFLVGFLHFWHQWKQNSHKIYIYTLTASLIAAMVSAVFDDWPIASCSAFDRTGCAHLSQKVVQCLSLLGNSFVNLHLNCRRF